MLNVIYKQGIHFCIEQFNGHGESITKNSLTLQSSYTQIELKISIINLMF